MMSTEIKRRKKQGAMRAIRPEVRHLYNHGMRPAIIAKRFGISVSTVYITTRGLPRQRGVYKDHSFINREQMVVLYQSGLSCREVGNKLGVPKGVVYRAVKRAEVVRVMSEGKRLSRHGSRKAIKFVCKICGKVKALAELTENRDFRPSLIGCKECV